MSTVHDMNSTFGNLNGGNESTNTIETTRKGGNVDHHMDGHGGQPGPTPGGGAGRLENLQGGVQVDDHMEGHGGQPGPTPGGARGAQRTYRGGSRGGHGVCRGDPAGPSYRC